MTTQKNFNVFLFILLLGVFSPLMAQNMSDSQVLEYVKEGIRQGKEQKQLASELARKGVTKEQAMRVKQLYEQQNNVNASNATGTDVNTRPASRMRSSFSASTGLGRYERTAYLFWASERKSFMANLQSCLPVL